MQRYTKDGIDQERVRIRKQVEALLDEEKTKLVNTESIAEGYGIVGAKEALKQVLKLLEAAS